MARCGLSGGAVAAAVHAQLLGVTLLGIGQRARVIRGERRRYQTRGVMPADSQSIAVLTNSLQTGMTNYKGRQPDR